MKFKSILSYFTWLVKWVIAIVCIIVVIFLAVCFDFNMDIAITISTSLILILLTYDLLKVMTRFTYFMENRRLSRPFKQKGNLTLYRWSEGIELEERLYYRILREDISEDPIKNLNSIKKRIKNACSGNISTLKLLKVYVEKNMLNNILDKFWTIVIGLSVATVTTIFTKLSSKDKFINLVHSYVTGTSHDIQISDITNVINYVTYFFILITFFVYTRDIFTRDKRRLLLLSKIIDVAISEIELKNNKTQ